MCNEAKENGMPHTGSRCSCQTRCTQTASHVLAARATSTYHQQTYLPRTQPAPFHVTYHAAGHDNQVCCHNRMRCSTRMPTTSQSSAWMQHMAPRTNRRQSVRRGREEGGRPTAGSSGVAPRATETTKQYRVGGGTSVALGSAWPAQWSLFGSGKQMPFLAMWTHIGF